MKKIIAIFLILAATILFTACSSSKHTADYSKTINGSWQLKTIVSEGVTGKINTKFFDEAGFNCFVGSSWSFSSNNHLGTYTISKNADECIATKRDISWSIDEPKDQPKQFYFKRLDANSEFRFTIIQLVKDSMQLKSDAIVDGRPASFTYNFIRL